MEPNIRYWHAMTDLALLQMLGQFIQKSRLDQNRTQQAVAEAAGINRSTLVQLEKGKGGTMLTFIQVLRALQQLELLSHFEVRYEISPLKLAEMQYNQRQRASRGKKVPKKPKSDW